MKFIILLIFLCATAFGQNTVSLLPHQKLLAAANGGQAITDMSSLYTGQAKFILTAKSDAGTNPTLAVKLQTSGPLTRMAEMVSDSTDTLEDVAHRTATDTSIQLAAKFTLATSGTISNLYLPLKKTGAPTGTLTVAIYADDGGDPTGSALATFSTLNVATLTTSYVHTNFTLTAPVDLAADDYHIVVTSNVTLSGSAFVSWRAITVASGGNANIYDTDWTADATADLEFRAFFYKFSDVTGGGFTTVTSTASAQTIELNVDNLGFVRAHTTIGGTNTPAFYTSLLSLVKTVQP